MVLCARLSCVCCCWYAWGIELSLLEFVVILFMIVFIKFTNLYLFFIFDNLVYVYMWIDFVLYDIHLWFFLGLIFLYSCVWFSRFVCFFGFVLLCVLDEEDVRSEFMCCGFLIIFFLFYFVKIDKLIFKILS